jgi:hypothetical protein
MRMWNVNPGKMCMKHLLGEHVEMHMFAGCLKKGISLQGYLDNQLVEIHNIKKRHDELALEMKRRGYKHDSEISLNTGIKAGYVDRKSNLAELRRRCVVCREHNL